MIIGEYNRENDLNVNPCKTKKLTNIRASGKDDAVTLTPVMPMTLEKAIQFIREDELVEVTPKVIRIRKTVLSIQERKVVSFEEAHTVFYDENAIEFFDDSHSDREERFIMLGFSSHLRLLVVCHCLRDNEAVIRIISARRATKAESIFYGGELHERRI
jgi:uncharacterized DUF497 family protein